MRAAILAGYQAVPELGRRSEPQPAQGQAVVELLAAALNPADLAIASGSFPAGSPPLPYVPGIEGVARSCSRRASRRGRASGRPGAASASPATAPSPSSSWWPTTCWSRFRRTPRSWLSPRSASSAWPPGCRSPGSLPCVRARSCSSSGRPGTSARSQFRPRSSSAPDASLPSAATRIGSSAAASLERTRSSLSAAATSSNGWRRQSRARRRRSFSTCSGACRSRSQPAVAAPGARLVRVGQAAAPTATLASGLVRGKQLQILGYSNFAVPQDALARGTDLIGHAVAGRIRLDAEAMPLAQAGEAWARQLQGHDRKLVLVP